MNHEDPTGYIPIVSALQSLVAELMERISTLEETVRQMQASD